MKLRQSVPVRSALWSLIASLALLACSANPPAATTGAQALNPSDEKTDLAAVYTPLRAAAGRVFALDPARSAVRIYAFRGGKAARLGHSHLLSAPQFLGYCFVPSEGANGARFDLQFHLDQLEIDNPEYRARLGGAFSAVLSPGDVQSVRTHMLGEENLQAERYPLVGIHSLQIVGEAPKFAARIRIELHGRQREMWVPLTVDGLPERLSVSGSLMLRQTDFDVQPYSVFGGFLAVQDELVIEFALVGA
jgi:hypothetical protein